MRVAILSRNPKLYSTRRLKEAGEARGHKVEVIDHMKCVLFIEKKNPVVLYQGKRLDYFDAIIPRIGASVTFYGAAVVRQFEMMKVFTAVESQALIRSRDKLRSLQILSRAGLGLPKTIFMDYSRETEGIVEAVGGAPVIIKLLEGTQGLGVVLAENKKAAKSVIEAFHGLHARIIVQEFIKEAKGADLRAFVVNGEVVGAMRRQAREGEFRSNLHRGGIAKVERFLKDAYLPALHRAGISKVGVFKPVETDSVNFGKKLFVLIPYSSLDQFGKLSETLLKDKQFESSGAEYLNAPFNDIPYARIESFLLYAFSAMPQMVVPRHSTPVGERIYELRSYEGHTEKIFKNKVKMFNDGDEVGLFKRLGFNAVFYAEVIVGSRMPNLMYMTTFPNKASRDEHWKAFSADPQWLELKGMDEYKNNVSKIDIYFLHPTDYSDI